MTERPRGIQPSVDGKGCYDRVCGNLPRWMTPELSLKKNLAAYGTALVTATGYIQKVLGQEVHAHLKDGKPDLENATRLAITEKIHIYEPIGVVVTEDFPTKETNELERYTRSNTVYIIEAQKHAPQQVLYPFSEKYVFETDNGMVTLFPFGSKQKIGNSQELTRAVIQTQKKIGTLKEDGDEKGYEYSLMPVCFLQIKDGMVVGFDGNTRIPFSEIGSTDMDARITNMEALLKTRAFGGSGNGNNNGKNH